MIRMIRIAKAPAKLLRHMPGVMNKTEAAYAWHLEGLKAAGLLHEWWFESMTLKIADQCRYTPDFAVINALGEMEYHEVKGERAIFRDDAKVKLRAAAEKYPFRFIAVYPKKGGGWDTEDFTAKGTEWTAATTS